MRGEPMEFICGENNVVSEMNDSRLCPLAEKPKSLVRRPNGRRDRRSRCMDHFSVARNACSGNYSPQPAGKQKLSTSRVLGTFDFALTAGERSKRGINKS